MIDSELLLYWLGVAVVLAPTIAMVFAGLLAVIEKRPSEKLLARLTQVAICTGLLSALAVLATMLITGVRSVPVELGYWTLLPDYHFEFRLLFDRLSVPFAIITFILCGTIGAFAARYMHRERGYQRFFSLLLVFVVGMLLTTLAGTIEVLFAGWELVGLSSALLVAFFHDRQNPVRNGLHIWTIYRFSDAALLAAVVLVHHFSGGGEFNMLLGAGPWPEGSAMLSSNQALVVGLLILVAAAGKSGLVPFSGWLPRAMEGPTPSSAVFYGALSVHLGAFLLLRLCPILELSLWLCIAVVAIGLATAVYATITSHVQTDIKSALAFASLAQVGLIVAEIGVGFRYLALIHILGHACFRMLQFLRAPNLLHEYHDLENAIGSHLPSTGVYWEKKLSTPTRRRLYRFALSRGYFDAWLRDYLVHPFVNVFRKLDHLERRWTALLSGQPSEPAANRRLQAQFLEDVV
jgi:NADH-quinone oxidoreductase subunit L